MLYGAFGQRSLQTILLFCLSDASDSSKGFNFLITEGRAEVIYEKDVGCCIEHIGSKRLL